MGRNTTICDYHGDNTSTFNHIRNKRELVTKGRHMGQWFFPHGNFATWFIATLLDIYLSQ